MRPGLWFSEVLKERKVSWLTFVHLKVCPGPKLYQVVKSSGVGTSHFPITLQFYSFRTSLQMGENRENQTVMAIRPLKRRNAFSFYFSRVLCICSHGTVQETGMEICRNQSCSGDWGLPDIQPHVKFMMHILLRFHTASYHFTSVSVTPEF